MADLAKILTQGDGGRVRVNVQDCASIESVLRDYFGGRFEVSPDAWPPSTGSFTYGDQSHEAVSLKGSLASRFLGVEGAKVDATFFLVNGSPEVVITITDPRDPWKLSSAFPQAQGLDLDSAIFHKCVFTLDSNRPYSLGDDFDALFQPEDAPTVREKSGDQPKTALYLAAQLKLSEVDEMLCNFLGEDKALTVAGPVQLADNGPRMRLATNDPGVETKSPAVSFSFPELLPKLELHYQFLTAPSSTGKIEIWEQLNTTFSHSDPDRTLTVPLRITFEPNSLTETLSIESFDQQSPLTFDNLVKLIPGDIGNAIPTDVRVLGDLKLTNLSFEVSTDPLELRAVNVRVELAKDGGWTIVPGLLIFKGLALDISVMHDMDGWQVQPYVTGTLDLAGGTLDVGVDVLGETLFCVLREKEKIQLNSLFKRFNFTAEHLPNTDGVDIDRLEIVGALDGSLYALDIGTKINWKPLDKVSIDGLFFSLEYEYEKDDGSDNTPAVTLGGSLTIAGVTLEMIGRHDKDGWQFEGRTGLDQPIPIGTLIDSGVKLFDSNVQLPPSLTGFSIENLGVSFNTATNKFTFTCEGKFKVEDTDVDCVVTIKRETGDTQFHGRITVEDLIFTGEIIKDKAATRFLLTYGSDQPKDIELKEIARTIFRDGPLAEVVEVTPELTIGVKDALFAYEKAEKSSFLVGAGFEINATVDTSKWGVIGSLLGGEQIGLKDLRVLVASNDFNSDQIEALNKLLPPGIEALPVPSSEEAGKSNGEGTPESKPPVAISKGFNFSGNLKLGNLTPPPLMLPVAGGQDDTGAGGGEVSTQPTTVEKPKTAKETSAESSTAKWIDIKKSLGPLYFGRVGFQYKDQKIGLLLDAAVDLAGLRVGLLGFQIRFPLQALKEPTFPDFDLEGLEIGFHQGPVEISGGLLKTTTKATENGQEVELTEFIGTILIKTEMFTISGFGAYAEIEHQPSLFLFAMLNMDLGGPPFFHVMGLAAGFGVNRTLNLPPIEEVQEFALVKAAVKPEDFRDFRAACTAISKVTTPKAGDYWLAAGIKFTSFEMIESFIMLSVSFGTETVITVLGLSRITVPKLPKADVDGKNPVPPIACAEMALKVSFRPESGVLMAEARLTSNSYLFTKDCKLTGGFAFYAWFKDLEIPSKTPGETVKISAGDFVVTLGGYHPRFKAPEHYPIVPRLGLTWQVSPNLRVAGELYFALTPTCLMAGGRLSASFQDGELRAWFDAYAHFFIAWQPLQYDAEAGVRIGVAYHASILGISATFSVELSADVHFWGPPFAGKADVHWTIISFTVYFGAAREKPTPPALEWGEFAQAFLPPAADKQTIADPLTIAVVRGVIKDVKAKEKNNKDYLVVNPYQLGVLVKSAMPAKTVAVANSNIPVTNPTVFGVRPMGIVTLDKSALTVTVSRDNSDGPDNSDMVAEALTQSLPGALWSGSSFDPKQEQKVELIDNLLTGVQFRPRPKEPTGTQKINDFQNLLDAETKTEQWQYQFAPTGQKYDPKKVIGDIASVNQSRENLLQAMADQELISKNSVPEQNKLQAAYTRMELQDTPVECGVGMLPQIPA